MTVISRRITKLLSCKQLVGTRTNYVPQDMLFGLQRDCRWAQWWLPTIDATNSRGSLWCIESHIARNLGSSSSWAWANSSWHIFTFGCSILLFKRSRSGNCNCFTLLPASATTATGLDGVSASIVPLSRLSKFRQQRCGCLHWYATSWTVHKSSRNACRLDRILCDGKGNLQF